MSKVNEWTVRMSDEGPSSTLPCPLCGSRLILPVIRRAIDCDIETHVYHCNGCGMEAPRHAWDYWPRPDHSDRDWSDHLRIQLAAEVEKVNKLQEQLSTEREKSRAGGWLSQAALDEYAKVEQEAQRLREQLAFDGGQRDEWFKALTTITKLKHQLAAAQATIEKAHFRFRPPPGDTAALDAAISAAKQEGWTEGRAHERKCAAAAMKEGK